MKEEERTAFKQPIVWARRELQTALDHLQAAENAAKWRNREEIFRGINGALVLIHVAVERLHSLADNELAKLTEEVSE